MSKQKELEQLKYKTKFIIETMKEAMKMQKFSDAFLFNVGNLINEMTQRIEELEAEAFIEQHVEEKTPIQAAKQSGLPEGIDLVWILAGGDVNAFVNYLRTLPGEGFNQITQNPAQLNSIITEMQMRFGHEEPTIDSDNMIHPPIQSSNVAAFKYDPNTQKMFVKFHSDGVEPIYKYEGVPLPIAKLIMAGNANATTKGKNKWGAWWPLKNPSLGASVNQYLKKLGFPYTKIR